MTINHGDGIRRLGEELIHQGRRFRLNRVTEELPNGTPVVREIVRHPGASVILPILANGEVLMVKQHRTAVGEPLLELPAGTLDAGEAPLAAAQRELREETGYEARAWRHMLSFFPSPGITDERMHLFAATELTAGEQHTDADEIVDVTRVQLVELERMVMAGEIRDGKTIIALLFYLRQQQGKTC